MFADHWGTGSLVSPRIPRRSGFPQWRPVQRTGVPRFRLKRTRRTSEPTPGLDLGPFRFTYGIALFAILIVAAVLRFIGLNWDESLYLHPDERFLAQVVQDIQWPVGWRGYFDSATSPLNPFNVKYTNYIYGTFPIFLTKFVGLLTDQGTYGTVHLPARAISAIADLGSLLMAAWAAKHLFGRITSLLTAGLLAISVLNIQAAHFSTTDSISAFFAIAAFALILKAGKTGQYRWFMLAGFAVGLAGASKPNLLLTAGFLALPLLEAVRIGGWDMVLPRAFRPYARQFQDVGKPPLLMATVLSGFVAVLTFRIGQPYAFAGPNIWNLRLDPRWTTNLNYWRDVQAGLIDMPPGIQWADRTPFVFILDNLIRWGMGPALGIASLIGLGWMLVSLVQRRRWPSWWILGLLGWIGLHIVLYGGGLIQVQRYLLPAYPFMIMLAAWFLVRLINKARTSSLRVRWLHPGYVLPVIVVISTLFYALAFVNSIYLKPHTRIEASQWMYDNLPPGSVITGEHWDDSLPLRIPGEDAGSFVGIQLELYHADDETKLATLVNQLDRADYVITSSNRVYGSTERIPERYPMTIAYYDALFDGSLGFELIETFEHPPELFGITFDDEWAEESLTVYDHPKVMIFKKTDAWSPNATFLMLDEALGDGALSTLRPIDLSADQLLLSDEDAARYANSGTWSDIFDRTSFTNAMPTLWWYLILQAFALPAIPLLWRMFPRLPDRGYALAKLIGILGVTYVVWLLASLKLFEFSATTTAFTWVGCLTFGLALVARRFGEFLDSLVRRWRWLVVTELLFGAAFLFSVWLRWLNPDLWHPSRGGEKPMDFAYFNAVIKSPYFPPYDPWFADGVLHYYYWGFVPWAAMSKLTGIVPEVAYNLAIPSLFALLLLMVWNVSAILISRIRVFTSDPTRAWGSLGLALLAPLFVGILGNLDMARRVGTGSFDYPTLPSWLDRFGIPGQIVHGIWNGLTASRALPTNAFWDPTRIIPGTINEFPYFSFLFADLHAHVMSMPIVAGGLVIAVGIADLRTQHPLPARPALLATLGGWRSAVPIGVLGGFVSGLLVASNTWDFPPAVALIAVAGLIASGVSTGWRFPWQTIKDAGIFAAIVYGSGQLLLYPYLSRYGSLPSGLEPATETTTLSDFLIVNGLLLYAVVGLLILEMVLLLRGLSQYGSAGSFTIFTIALVGIGALAVALATGSVAILLVLLIGMVGLAILNRYQSSTHLIVFAMIGLALALLLFPERFRLANDVGRMNTVFKLSLHAWILLGVAATISIAMIFSRDSGRSWFGTSEEHQPQQTHLGGWLSSRTWLAGLAVLILAAAMYPALATAPRVADRFNDLPGTLDGLAFMDEAVHVEYPETGDPVEFSLAGDAEAVIWMQDNIVGSPVILEAQMPQYRWGSRISIQTGLPTVLGWSWHQVQQRPGYGAWIQERETDIKTMYSSPVPFASIQPLLEKYGVRLIIVGELERAIYPEEGLAKFESAVAAGQLTVIYQTDSMTIYSYPP